MCFCSTVFATSFVTEKKKEKKIPILVPEKSRHKQWTAVAFNGVNYPFQGTTFIVNRCHHNFHRRVRSM